MPSFGGTRLDRRLLIRVLLDDISAIEYPQWASTTPTAVATLTTGLRVTVQEYPDEATVESVCVAARALTEADIPVAQVRERARVDSRFFVVWEFVEGLNGALLLDLPRASELADLMGGLAQQIRRVPAPLPTDAAWRDPEGLLAAARSWGEHLERRRDRREVAACADLVSSTPWTPAVSHGDYAPINVLVADRRLSALLDLRTVCRRHPLIDVAWWILIVRHHHPDSFRRVASRFVRSAHVHHDIDSRLLPSLAVLRCTELLARSDPSEARHVLRLTATALAWKGAVIAGLEL